MPYTLRTLCRPTPRRARVTIRSTNRRLTMARAWLDRITTDLNSLRQQGQFKTFRTLQKPMGPESHMQGVGPVIVLCSNDYLGLANHPEVVAAAKAAAAQWG